MMRIDRASLKDANTLARLNQQVHRLHVERAPHFFRQSTLAEVRNAFSDLLNQTNVRAFIAYSDDAAVGYVLAMVHERPGSAFIPARRCVYVEQISVEREWQRRGVGRRLMRAVRDYAREAGIEELETDIWTFNDQAQVFLTKFGFQPKVERWWMRLED
jgi:GNAT superfamily N-acetyltransferase